MLLDLTKSSMILPLLKKIVASLQSLSQYDTALHKLTGTLLQYMRHPQSVDSIWLNTTLASAKDVASSYDTDKELPSLFFHLFTEIQHQCDSQRLANMPILPAQKSTGQLLLNIERLAKHSSRA